MAGGQHHAFTHAKLHLAWRQVGHHDGEFAFEVFGLVHAGHAREHVARLALAHIQGEAKQLGRAFHCFAVDDFGNAQIDLGKVVDADGGGDGLAAWGDYFLCHDWRFKQGFQLLGGDALHEVLVRLNVGHVASGVPVLHGRAGEGFDRFCKRGQHRGQVAAQLGKRVDQQRADLVQGLVVGGVFGQVPGLVLVHIGVDFVGQQHDVAGGFAIFAGVVGLGDAVFGGVNVAQQGRALLAKALCELALKALGQEARRTRRDVDELANQIAVHAQHEVFGVEVHIFVFVVEFGGQVIAQPLGVHAQAQVLEWVQARATALAHLLAVVDGQEAVHKHIVGRFAAAEMQHGGPEQGVKGDDVFADEVVLLQLVVGHVGVVVFAAFVQQVLQRRQVAHGRVEPHIKVFGWCPIDRRIRDFDAKVRRVTRDVPVAQAFAGAAIGVGAHGEPLFDLVGHFGLQFAVLRPLFQKRDAAWVRQFEEEVLRAFQLGLGTRQR